MPAFGYAFIQAWKNFVRRKIGGANEPSLYLGEMGCLRPSRFKLFSPGSIGEKK
jgi:hypothetical protein